MAVPGSPLDPRARGSNALIKQGATLIEDANDVLARLVEAPAGAVAAALTELELEGQAASLPGGYAAQARAAFN